MRVFWGRILSIKTYYQEFMFLCYRICLGTGRGLFHWGLARAQAHEELRSHASYSLRHTYGPSPARSFPQRTGPSRARSTSISSVVSMTALRRAPPNIDGCETPGSPPHLTPQRSARGGHAAINAAHPRIVLHIDTASETYVPYFHRQSPEPQHHLRARSVRSRANRVQRVSIKTLFGKIR